jgi:TatD DNase family protein
MLIDSHAHLDMEEFDKDRDEVLKRAVEGGVTRVIAIGVDLQSSVKALRLAKTHDFVFSTVGCHPHEAKELDRKTLQEIGSLSEDPRVVAWGEIGLDFFKLYSPREKQLAVFEEQLDFAAERGLPVVIHDRDAHSEILHALKRRKNQGRRGVIHCFSGDYELALEFIRLGFFISLPGTVTYPKATDLQEVAARIPLETLLVETDAPYLTPVPLRGKRNEPLFVTHTAKRIAELRSISFEELSEKTVENTVRLFGLEGKP